MPIPIPFIHNSTILPWKEDYISFGSFSEENKNCKIRTHNRIWAIILRIFGRVVAVALVDKSNKVQIFYLNKLSLENWLQKNSANTKLEQAKIEESICSICKNLFNPKKQLKKIVKKVIKKSKFSKTSSSRSTSVKKPAVGKTSTSAKVDPKKPVSKTKSTSGKLKSTAKKVQVLKKALKSTPSTSKAAKDIAAEKARIAAKKAEEPTRESAKKAEFENWLKSQEELVNLEKNVTEHHLPRARKMIYQDDGELKNIAAWDEFEKTYIGKDKLVALEKYKKENPTLFPIKTQSQTNTINTVSLQKMIQDVDIARMHPTKYHLRTSKLIVNYVREHGFNNTVTIGQGQRKPGYRIGVPFFHQGNADFRQEATLEAHLKFTKMAEIKKPKTYGVFEEFFFHAAKKVVDDAKLKNPEKVTVLLGQALLVDFFKQRKYDAIYIPAGGSVVNAFTVVFDPAKNATPT